MCPYIILLRLATCILSPPNTNNHALSCLPLNLGTDPTSTTTSAILLRPITTCWQPDQFPEVKSLFRRAFQSLMLEDHRPLAFCDQEKRNLVTLVATSGYINLNQVIGHQVIRFDRLCAFLLQIELHGQNQHGSWSLPTTNRSRCFHLWSRKVFRRFSWVHGIGQGHKTRGTRLDMQLSPNSGGAIVLCQLAIYSRGLLP